MKKLTISALIIFGLASHAVKATTITLADYLVTGTSGDSWTYVAGGLGTDEFGGLGAGESITLSEPPYLLSLFPITVETGQVVVFENGISLYADIINNVSVLAGTFDNVLRLTFLDENFNANSVNTEIGISAAIDFGVTDISAYAIGIGQIGFIDIAASSGDAVGSYELSEFSVTSVPVPATVWLFGSGLIGLIGVVGRKKA